MLRRLLVVAIIAAIMVGCGGAGNGSRPAVHPGSPSQLQVSTRFVRALVERHDAVAAGALSIAELKPRLVREVAQLRRDGVGRIVGRGRALHRCAADSMFTLAGENCVVFRLRGEKLGRDSRSHIVSDVRFRVYLKIDSRLWKVAMFDYAAVVTAR
jgi:hypothetical protein